ENENEVKDYISELYGLTNNGSTPGNVKNLRNVHGLSNSNLLVGKVQGSNSFNSTLNNDLFQDALHMAMGRSRTHTPTAWQNDVKQRFIKHENMLILVPPAAGKTAPIMSAIQEIDKGGLYFDSQGKFKGINNMSRILYVVPTKQLALQIGRNDIIPSIYEGLDKLLNSNNRHHIAIINNLFKYLLKTRNRIDLNNRDYLMMEIRRTVTDLVSIQTDSFKPKDIKSILTKNVKPFVVSTYEPAVKIMEKHHNDFDYILIDEKQETLAKADQQFSTRDDFIKYERYSRIVKLSGRNTSVVIMSGSMSADTANHVTKTFSNEFKRKFTIVPKIGSSDANSARNRSNIIIVPDEGMQSYSDRLKLIKNKVMANSTNNLMIVFSIARNTKFGIFRVLEDLIDKLPAKHPQSLFSDPKFNIKDANVSKPSGSTLTDREFFNIKISDFIKGEISDTDNILFEPVKAYNKLFEKNFDISTFTDLQKQEAIKNAEKQSLEFIKELNIKYNKGKFKIEMSNDSDAVKNKKLHALLTNHKLNLIKNEDGLIESKRKILEAKEKRFDLADVNDIEFLKYFDIDAAEIKGQRTQETGLLDRPDENNLLYQSVLRGVAPMIGGMHQRHKDTVMKLFSSGKINFMLATSSVGVGANLTVVDLYMPSLDTPKVSGFGPLDESTLMQVLHRAGRKGGSKIPQAFIHVGLSDVERAKNIIETGLKNSQLDVNKNLLIDFEKVAKMTNTSLSAMAFQQLIKGDS
ncbi:MAG: hypothetical protein DRG78_05390, partial [Epsilonproteobacteria bacterium]